MQESNKRQEHHIELYLLNRLDSEQQKKLEQQLESDPALRKKVEYRKLVISAIQQSRRKELSEFLDEHASTTLSGNFWSKGWTIFSAIIVVITGIALIFLGDNGSEPGTKLQQFEETEQIEEAPGKFTPPANSIMLTLDEMQAERIIKVSEVNEPGKITKGGKEVKIEFWTPADTELQAYQYYKHTLKLVNVDPANQPEVASLKEGKFLMMNGQVYPLADENQFFLLEDTDDEEILKMLEF